MSYLDVNMPPLEHEKYYPKYVKIEQTKYNIIEGFTLNTNPYTVLILIIFILISIYVVKA